MLGCSFATAPAGDCSIELDPRTVDGARLQVLADLGFRRLSFGVQDVDGLGVSAINRIGAADAQNALTLEEYGDCFERGRLPVARGVAWR